MSYKRQSDEARFENQWSRPGIEIWPEDDDAMWLLSHGNPVRDIICATPEYGDSPFCGIGHH